MSPAMVAPLLAAVSTFCVATASGEDVAKDNPARVTLTVRLSVDSYDPSRPEGAFTCSLKNDSRQAIDVPAEYDGRQLVIYGHGKTHRSVSRLWKPYRPGIDPKPEETIARKLRVDPGETKVVFEVSLKEILTPRTGVDRSWAWDWRNRTESPATPIHGWRRPGFEESASFFAEIQIGEETYRSESVVLSVGSRAGRSAPGIDSPDNVDRFGDALPAGVVRRFGSLRFRHAGGYKSISELAFSPDGKQIASAGPDHTVRVWDLDGRERMRLDGKKTDQFASVAFSPDGSRLAAHGDNELRVWDVASGELVMRIERGRGSSPVFSADSKRVAATHLLYTPMAGFRDRSFREWDVASGELLRSLDSSKELLWPLAIAVDCGLTASHDETGIKVRRLDTGETVCTYNKHFIDVKHGLHARHSDGVPTVAFAPDGKTAASSCLHDGVLEIHVWDPETGETNCAHRTKTTFAAYTLAFSPDGRTLLGAASVRDFDGGYADGKIAVDSPARIELIDVMTAQPRLHIEGFAAPALSPDGSLLAAARFDRIQLFDARTGEPLKQYAGHDAPIQKVAASRDGKRFASVGRDHTIRYWDAATGDLLSQREVAGGISNASFSGDLTRVAVLHGELENNGRRRVTVWDDASDKPPFDLAMPDGNRLAALSADGHTLATWGKDDLRVWKVASGGAPVRIASPGPPIGICGFGFSDDGRRVIAGEMSEPLRIWDTKTGKRMRELELRAERKLGSAGGPFALSPDGKTLATHAHDTIVLYELETGARVATLPRQTTGYVAELAFSPDGKLLASSARDGSIRLLEVSTGKVLADFQTHAAAWTSIAFSPDGNRLLSGGGAAVLELRDIASFRPAPRGEARVLPMEIPNSRTAPQETAPESTDFERLFRHIDNARESGKLETSSVAGGQGGGAFESTLDEPTLLLGFDYTFSTFYGGRLTVKSLRPIYMTRKGEKLGDWYGVPHGNLCRNLLRSDTPTGLGRSG